MGAGYQLDFPICLKNYSSCCSPIFLFPYLRIVQFGNRIRNLYWVLSQLGPLFIVLSNLLIGLNLFGNLASCSKLLFGWKLFRNVLPFDANGQSKNIFLTSICVRCKDLHIEDRDHVFVYSNLVVGTWDHFGYIFCVRRCVTSFDMFCTKHFWNWALLRLASLFSFLKGTVIVILREI